MTDYNFKPKLARDDYGWHKRHLPHFDGPQQTQFVTFRLADSMPEVLLDRWRKECKSDADFRRRIERFLDTGAGECWLRDVEVATIIRDALMFHAARRYDLISWVVMPNHGHVLLTPYENQHLPDILHSIKSFTALKANKYLNRSGQFWQHETFDRYIRNSRHLLAVVKYIENNPVKASLCRRPEEWRFSSAFERTFHSPSA